MKKMELNVGGTKLVESVVYYGMSQMDWTIRWFYGDDLRERELSETRKTMFLEVGFTEDYVEKITEMRVGKFYDTLKMMKELEEKLRNIAGTGQGDLEDLYCIVTELLRSQEGLVEMMNWCEDEEELDLLIDLIEGLGWEVA